MRRFFLLVLRLLGSLVVTGCAATRNADAPMILSATVPSIINQINYGRDARFVQCRHGQCPTRTLKTLVAVERASARAPAVQPPPAPAIAISAESHRSLNVLFHSGSTTLTSAGSKAIEEVAADLKRARRIVIRGRTDATGSRRSNDLVAAHRAEAVRDYVRQLGVRETVDITLESQGKCCYAADNRLASGRAANRRVEVEMFVVNP
jgi:outer membrane protein OmpA-like peptidoglycan-associated protein